MKNKIIFIGAIDKGNLATNGETMKNQMLLRRFESLCDKVVVVDAYQWRKRPWCFIQMVGALLGNRGAKVVVSASGAASHLFNFLYYVPLKKNVYEWVIGGNRAEKIRSGAYNVKVLKSLKKIIVEGECMVRELNYLGLNNVVCVPNFKPVDYNPKNNIRKEEGISRFVFLSRVHPDKGVKEIVDACEKLNKSGYGKKYYVDFYGAFDTDYWQEFSTLIAPFENVHYKGYLNLMNESGYDSLSSYDVMLFPTYWDGEGFPGIAIDAYMSGLPIIASDWSMNTEVVEDGKTVFIIPTHNSAALASKMRGFIDGDYNLAQLRENCLKRAKRYDYRNVVNSELLKYLGLIV